VRASGRRVQPVVNGWRWFGLKVHARNVPLTADLEMHLSPGGYVGMSRLADGEANICGLFRRAANASDASACWQETLRGSTGSQRHERLREAKFDEDSFCSVAGLSLAPQRASAGRECSVGDAITMIPPVTGNGMSMAFESAEIAVEPLAAYSAGKVSWNEAQQTIARLCDETFSRRLAWAVWLQRLMLAVALAVGKNTVRKWRLN
jgi:2-polyprenyl-6-methoxyphenol hydroxylase-like FAD-dependent oxidoreductase